MPIIYRYMNPVTVSQERYDELITREGYYATPTKPVPDRPAPGIRGLSSSYYLWHRGAERVFPENTKEGFRSALALGAPVIKTDVYDIDGGRTLGICHDSTVTRTTTSTGNCIDKSLAEWRNLVVDAGSWFAPAWGNLAALTLNEVLDEFGKQCVLVVDSKRTQATDLLIATIKRYNLESQVMVTSSDTTLADAAKCKAAGLEYLFYYNGAAITSPTPSAAIAAGATALGIGLSYTDAQITTVVTAANAAGLPVHGFTVKRRFERDRFASLGVNIWHCADPVYVAATAAMRTTDNFATGSPHYGLVPSDSWTIDTLVPYVGSAGARRLSFANSSGGTFAMLGYLGPIAPTTFTVSGSVTFDTLSGGGSNWCSIGLAKDDRTFNGNAIIEGYNCIIRESGNFQVYRQTPGATVDGVTASGASAGQGSAGEAGAFTGGEVVPWSLAVTPTQITFTVKGVSSVASDNTHRPLKYVHVGKASGNTLAVSYSGITVA